MACVLEAARRSLLPRLPRRTRLRLRSSDLLSTENRPPLPKNPRVRLTLALR